MTMTNTNVRLPNELHLAIKKAAGNNRRSMNAEILYALEFYLKNAPTAYYLPKGKRDERK